MYSFSQIVLVKKILDFLDFQVGDWRLELMKGSYEVESPYEIPWFRAAKQRPVGRDWV